MGIVIILYSLSLSVCLSICLSGLPVSTYGHSPAVALPIDNCRSFRCETSLSRGLHWENKKVLLGTAPVVSPSRSLSLSLPCDLAIIEIIAREVLNINPN